MPKPPDDGTEQLPRRAPLSVHLGSGVGWDAVVEAVLAIKPVTRKQAESYVARFAAGMRPGDRVNILGVSVRAVGES